MIYRKPIYNTDKPVPIQIKEVKQDSKLAKSNEISEAINNMKNAEPDDLLNSICNLVKVFNP